MQKPKEEAAGLTMRMDALRAEQQDLQKRMARCLKDVDGRAFQDLYEKYVTLLNAYELLQDAFFNFHDIKDFDRHCLIYHFDKGIQISEFETDEH